MSNQVKLQMSEKSFQNALYLLEEYMNLIDSLPSNMSDKVINKKVADIQKSIHKLEDSVSE